MLTSKHKVLGFVIEVLQCRILVSKTFKSFTHGFNYSDKDQYKSET